MAATPPLLVVLLSILHGALSASETESRVVIKPLDTTTGTFQVYVADKLWLSSGPITVMNDGVELSSADKENGLVKIGQQSFMDHDEFGPFTSEVTEWKASKGDFRFNTYIHIYNDEPMIVFGQQFVNGANKTSKGDDSGVMSSFPAIYVKQEEEKLGFLTYYNVQISGAQIGQWSPGVEIQHGFDGGFPMVLFDAMMENTLVLSPFNTFMSAGTDFIASADNSSTMVNFGILSSVDSVPVGYEYQTVLVAGDNVTGTMMHWGETLQRHYGKDSSYRETDLTLNYLGYWTDAGACYFHNTGRYKDYEEALLAVYEEAQKLEIPFRYVQFDDWWYYQDEKGRGCLNWTVKPDLFPNGVKAVTNKTHWPIHAHNKYFSSATVYAKQNGGQYNFIMDVDNHIGLPADEDFWIDLLGTKKREWDLVVYEQDFLITAFEKQKQLQTQLNLGRTWLKQMGDAAQQLDIRIQYCMSLTRNVLQSVEIPAVTQVRASRDYHPGNDQWAIGDSSILAYSVGLSPSKDNFHTFTVENGKCAFTNPEPKVEIETFMAALSGGIVGPSDTVGSFNRSLIMATCMSDGLLLKPSRPAMSLESMFLQRAFGKGGPKGYVYSTYSEVSGYSWYYIIASNITEEYMLYPKELPATRNTNSKSDSFHMVAYRSSIISTTVFDIANFTQSSPIKISMCMEPAFQLWVLAPILGHGTDASLLGELDKVIKVSPTRFTSIESNDGYNHIIYIRGAPQEVVHVSFLQIILLGVYTVDCTISSDGTATLVGNVYNSYKC